ncbi:X-linked retinitis pigmentosa GTPase regulator-interacting protein 1, partial [Gonapodya sp. JEL0774]
DDVKLQQFVNILREKLNTTEDSLENALKKISELEEGSHGVRLQDDLDKVTLQKDLATNLRKLRETEAKAEQLEDRCRTLERTREEALKTASNLNEQLREETNQRLDAEKKATKADALERKTKELNEIISDLRSEKSLLMEEQSRLISNQMTRARERELIDRHERELTVLRGIIAQLESQAGDKAGDRGQMLSKIATLTEEIASLREERSREVVDRTHLEARNEELERKLSLFSSEGLVDMEEVAEVLAWIRWRKEKGFDIGLNARFEAESLHT